MNTPESGSGFGVEMDPPDRDLKKTSQPEVEYQQKMEIGGSFQPSQDSYSA